MVFSKVPVVLEELMGVVPNMLVNLLPMELNTILPNQYKPTVNNVCMAHANEPQSNLQVQCEDGIINKSVTSRDSSFNQSSLIPAT